MRAPGWQWPWGPLRVRGRAGLVSHGAPDLELPIVVEEPPAAGGQLVDRPLPHGRIDHIGWIPELLVSVALDHDVAGGVQLVRKVIDGMAVRQPDRQAVVRRHRCAGWNDRSRLLQLGDGTRA